MAAAVAVVTAVVILTDQLDFSSNKVTEDIAGVHLFYFFNFIFYFSFVTVATTEGRVSTMKN